MDMHPVRYTMHLCVGVCARMCVRVASRQKASMTQLQLFSFSAVLQTAVPQNTLLWITARAFYLGHILCFSGQQKGSLSTAMNTFSWTQPTF